MGTKVMFTTELNNRGNEIAIAKNGGKVEGSSKWRSYGMQQAIHEEQVRIRREERNEKLFSKMWRHAKALEGTSNAHIGSYIVDLLQCSFDSTEDIDNLFTECIKKIRRTVAFSSYYEGVKTFLRLHGIKRIAKRNVFVEQRKVG